MKGKPVRGVFSGFFFGLFLALTLQQYAVYPLNTLSLIGFPLIGIALGLVLAYWAPFSRSDSGN